MNPLLIRACIAFAAAGLLWVANRVLTPVKVKPQTVVTNPPQPVADVPHRGGDAKISDQGGGNSSNSGGSGDPDRVANSSPVN